MFGTKMCGVYTQLEYGTIISIASTICQVQSYSCIYTYLISAFIYIYTPIFKIKVSEETEILRGKLMHTHMCVCIHIHVSCDHKIQ